MKTLIIGATDSDWIKKVKELSWEKLSEGDPREVERIRSLLSFADRQTEWGQLVHDEIIEKLTSEGGVMVTKIGNVGDWFSEFERERWTSPVGKWMRQFAHIKDCTQVNFNSWGDLVGTVMMSGIQITDDKFAGEDFEGEKGAILYALTYKGRKVGYASDYPMIIVDSEVWR